MLMLTPDAMIPHEYAENLDTVERIPVQAVKTQLLTAMDYGPYFLWRILPEGFLISMN